MTHCSRQDGTPLRVGWPPTSGLNELVGGMVLTGGSVQTEVQGVQVDMLNSGGGGLHTEGMWGREVANTGKESCVQGD